MSISLNSSFSTISTFGQLWEPSSRHSPCPICENTSGWCSVSQSDSNFVTCKNTVSAPIGWKKIKDTTDGGGVYTMADSANQPTKTPREFPATAPSKYQSTDHATRNEVYSRLLVKNGHLAGVYQQELQRRGLDQSQINQFIARNWGFNWQSGISSDFNSSTANIAGIDPRTNLTCGHDGLMIPAIKDGQMIGGQVYTRAQIDFRLGQTDNAPEKPGKYVWLSSTFKGGVDAHTFDTQENPLFRVTTENGNYSTLSL